MSQIIHWRHFCCQHVEPLVLLHWVHRDSGAPALPPENSCLDPAFQWNEPAHLPLGQLRFVVYSGGRRIGPLG